jgi:hypothetical protein
LAPDPALKGKVMTVMKSHEQLTAWDGSSPWYYKGAKMCLIWPLWHKAFPDAKWVIVRRDDEDIINSCLRTGFMKKHATREGWQGWVDHHKARFVEMKEAGLDVVEVWPTAFINGNYSLIRETIIGLGLSWNRDAVRGFVDPDLYTEVDSNGLPGH